MASSPININIPNMLANLNIPVDLEVTSVQDVAVSLLGLKRTNTSINSYLDLESNKKSKQIDLTIENLYSELLANFRIDPYEIILSVNKIFIDLGDYKIKLFQNSNSITMCIINIQGVPIRLHDIDFSTPCKNFYSMEKLIEEIVRIIKCNYNIRCYYELFKLKEKLTQAGFNPEFNNDRLFVTILRNGINVRLNLFYPYKLKGNRGVKYVDPEFPCVLSAIISNVGLNNIRNVLGLNFTGMSFRNFNNLKIFLEIFPNYKFYTSYESKQNLSNLSNSSNSLNLSNNEVKAKILSQNKRFCCNSCDYKTDVKITFINHMLSKHATPEQRRLKYPYYCAKCDIGAMSPSIFENHCATPSHLKNIK